MARRPFAYTRGIDRKGRFAVFNSTESTESHHPSQDTASSTRCNGLDKTVSKTVDAPEETPEHTLPSGATLNLTPSALIDIEKATPMMQQFLRVKQDYPGVLVLYRMGDFYETFFEDALIAAKALEITLTARDSGALGKIPMAGVPVRAASNYMQRLIEKNFKIAICEQMEDPAQAKGLVERRVTRVISKGTTLDNGFLPANQHHYLAAIIPGAHLKTASKQGDLWGLAYCDVTTGVFEVAELPYGALLNELDKLQPAELLTLGKKVRGAIVDEWLPNAPDAIVNGFACTPRPPGQIDFSVAETLIRKTFDLPSLESFGLASRPVATVASGMILQYLEATYIEEKRPIFERIVPVSHEHVMELTSSSRRNLELLQTARTGDVDGSLLGILDKTLTPMGGRLIRDWIQAPSIDIADINRRLDTIERLTQQANGLLAPIRATLPNIYDLERLAMKLANGTLLPREMLAVKRACQVLPRLSDLVASANANDVFYLAQLADMPQELSRLGEDIEAAIADNAPMSVKDAGIFKADYHPELKRLRDLTDNQTAWQADYEERERARTGLKNLKLGFNNAFGFYIEISKAQAKDAPPEYHRKQTLTNAERFVTPELKAHEEAVLSAGQQLTDLEYTLYTDFRQRAAHLAPLLKDVSRQVAALDVLQAFALVSLERHYTRPIITDDTTLELRDARHPVIETLLPLGQYVSNDCSLSSGASQDETPQVMMITGPNMAGKSTYMRQVALCILMGQMGCFVPASVARFGLVDKLFTRIGAVDDLGRGQSTFMVEMVEVAEILNCATDRSLVILDEIGRGTSTFDGISIAWSIAEHLITHNKSRTLFATHYHELNTMEHLHPKIHNARVLVNEDAEGELAFLYRVAKGAAQKSYGIHVARMAGLPKAVIQKAERLLAKIQEQDLNLGDEKRRKALRTHAEQSQLTLFQP
jgi:DNA mismatch repair protein MutS